MAKERSKREEGDGMKRKRMGERKRDGSLLHNLLHTEACHCRERHLTHVEICGLASCDHLLKLECIYLHCKQLLWLINNNGWYCCACLQTC